MIVLIELPESFVDAAGLRSHVYAADETGSRGEFRLHLETVITYGDGRKRVQSFEPIRPVKRHAPGYFRTDLLPGQTVILWEGAYLLDAEKRVLQTLGATYSPVKPSETDVAEHLSGDK